MTNGREKPLTFRLLTLLAAVGLSCIALATIRVYPVVAVAAILAMVLVAGEAVVRKNDVVGIAVLFAIAFVLWMLVG